MPTLADAVGAGCTGFVTPWTDHEALILVLSTANCPMTMVLGRQLK